MDHTTYAGDGDGDGEGVYASSSNTTTGGGKGGSRGSSRGSSGGGSGSKRRSGVGEEQRARYVAALTRGEKPELVKLNIGGMRYTTTKATLTRIEDSFFKGLLDGDIPSTLDDEGAFFIDREGRYFEPILNYMRTGDLIIPPTMPKSAVLAEADFYCIAPVVTSLQLEESDACGGKLFNALLRPRGGISPATFLLSMENHLIATFNDGCIEGWSFQVGEGWVREFNDQFPISTEGEIENVAFFSQGSRWFLAVFANKALHVWKRQEKIGSVRIQTNKVDSLFFVRTGQNLVAINHTVGHVAILSLASLSLRVLNTAPHGISSACHDALHIASYCCSAGVIYELMIGHNDNTCLQELYRDPNQEDISVIVNKEQRTLFYGTANGTLRRLDFPSSEIGGTCQSTLLLSGHIHPAGHVRCWNNYDVTQMNSYSIPPGALLLAPYLLRPQEDRVHIYDVLTGNMLHTIYSVNGAHVTTLCVCHDKSFFGGMLLVTAHSDGTLQLWSLGLLSLLLREQHHQASPHPPKKI